MISWVEERFHGIGGDIVGLGRFHRIGGDFVEFDFNGVVKSLGNWERFCGVGFHGIKLLERISGNWGNFKGLRGILGNWGYFMGLGKFGNREVLWS